MNGDREEKEIKSDAHAKIEFAGYGIGVERTVEGGESKATYQLLLGKDGIESSGGQVGAGVNFCVGEVCKGLEGGVEAGKAAKNFRNWLNSQPDPGPFSYKNK